MLKSFCLWLRLCSSITGVPYVIDGDTIAVKSYHVRLEGVDAEELNEPYGPQAKAMLKFIIGRNRVTCKLTGERSHERYVGVCYIDVFGNPLYDIAIRMIQSGYALDCAHYSHGRYRPYEPADARNKLIQKPYC